MMKKDINMPDSPHTARGERHTRSVALVGSNALVNRKHSPNHDSLLFYVLIAAQVELCFQLACRLCRERSEDAEKGT